MKLTGFSNKNLYGDWNFANDGGAVSTISLGVFLPQNSVLNRFWVKPVTAVTSGGSALISFGLTGVSDNLFPGLLFSGFQILNFPLVGVNFSQDTFETSTTTMQQVQMTISGAALTGGRLIFCVNYDECPI